MVRLFIGLKSLSMLSDALQQPNRAAGAKMRVFKMGRHARLIQDNVKMA